MANEFRHKDVIAGRIREIEYEHVNQHILNGQATGDIVYASSASQLSGLVIGATDTILSVQGGVPTWRTPANILTDLSGQAGAAFDWNGQNLTNVGGITLTIVTLGDDEFIVFGGVHSLGHETADVNANALILALANGGATDVPAFIIGDQSILNADLAAHNGLTEPTVAIWNSLADAYVSLDAGDVNGAGKGLYFKAAADENVNIITVSVTGTPNIIWDEGNNAFVASGTFQASSIYATSQFLLPSGGTFNCANADDAYFQIRVRDSGVGLVEVARGAGAADPYFCMGGSQEFKFYNSGVADFGGFVTIADTKGFYTGVSASDYLLLSAYNTNDVARIEAFRITNSAVASGLAIMEVTADFYLVEKASAGPDIPGRGQFWVKNATPNTPYFTDDAGTDHEILTGATGIKHEFHVPFEDPTGTVGNWDVVEINATQAVHFVVQVPENFESLVNARVIMIPDATETIQWDVLVSVAAAGEAYNNDDRSALNETLAVTADQLTEADISGVLTGLAAGDYVGIDFQSDTANLRIIGFEFDYL